MAPRVKAGEGSLVRTGPEIDVFVGRPSTTVHDALAGLLKTGGNPGHIALTDTVWGPTGNSGTTTGLVVLSHCSVSILICHRSHLESETLLVMVRVPAATKVAGASAIVTFNSWQPYGLP